MLNVGEHIALKVEHIALNFENFAFNVEHIALAHARAFAFRNGERNPLLGSKRRI